MSHLTTSLEGLGLPGPSYFEFATLLAYITQGESYCAPRSGGYCILENACEAYPSLWDTSFRVQFYSNAPENETTVLILPLATFAINNKVNECELKVHYLDMLADGDDS